MNKPHKHAEVIKAWADGAEIQVLHTRLEIWMDCIPSWEPDLEYRVKRSPKPDVTKYLGFDLKEGVKSWEIPHWIGDTHYQVNHWDNIIELVFDGETGKLKDVCVMGKEET